MRLARYFGLLILLLLGFGAIVFGEADDSPGLQGIGLILVLSALYRVWKQR